MLPAIPPAAIRVASALAALNCVVLVTQSEIAAGEKLAPVVDTPGIIAGLRRQIPLVAFSPKKRQRLLIVGP
jgi:hypothetical protein